MEVDDGLQRVAVESDGGAGLDVKLANDDVLQREVVAPLVDGVAAEHFHLVARRIFDLHVPVSGSANAVAAFGVHYHSYCHVRVGFNLQVEVEF